MKKLIISFLLLIGLLLPANASNDSTYMNAYNVFLYVDNLVILDDYYYVYDMACDLVYYGPTLSIFLPPGTYVIRQGDHTEIVLF